MYNYTLVKFAFDSTIYFLSINGSFVSTVFLEP